MEYEFDSKKIGENIKKARIKKGYTQERFAERLEVSVKYVSIIERGMVGMKLQLLAKICNVLEVQLEDIVR